MKVMEPVIRGNDVSVVMRAGSNEVKYANYQYGLDENGKEYPIRHVMRGGIPGKMTDASPDNKGGGETKRYQRSYRRLIKLNKLTKIALKWWHRTWESNTIKRFATEIFIKKLQE